MVKRYFLWKAPIDGAPEMTSGGHGVGVIPGFKQWVLLHGTVRPIPPDAIPVSVVTAFLDNLGRKAAPKSTIPADERIEVARAIAKAEGFEGWSPQNDYSHILETADAAISTLQRLGWKK